MKITDIIAHPLSVALAAGRDGPPMNAWTAPRWFSWRSAPTKASSASARSLGPADRHLRPGEDVRQCGQRNGPALPHRDLDERDFPDLAMPPRRPWRLGWHAGAAATATSGRRSWRRSGGSTLPCGTSRARRPGCRCFVFSAAPGPRFLPMRPAGTTWKVNHSPPPPRNWRVSFPMGIVPSASGVVLGCCVDEVTRIRAVREAIGPDVLLMLDMNAPYDVEGCITFAKAVAPYDIFWLEEPLHWYLQPADFQRLAAASPIPLAARRAREWHRYTVRDFIDSGAIRYGVPGFHATRRIYRIVADRALCRTERRADRPAFGGPVAWPFGLGIRRRRVRRRIA